MLRWAYIFLIVAVVAALVGFGGSAHGLAHLGLYLALVALILAIGAYMMHRRSLRG